MKKRISATLVAIGAALSLVALSAPPAQAAEPKLGAVFNYPKSWAISNRVTAMINATPKGAAIKVALYRLDDNDDRVLPALRKALARGVKVQVVVDKSDRNKHPLADPGLKALGNAIKAKMGAMSNPDKASFLVLCNEGCIGDEYNHNKFFLFSTMGSKKKVVMQSTANVVKDNATKAWNAAFSVAGRTALYNAYASYFDDLAHQVENSNYYRSTTDGPYKAYFFPRASSTGDQDDPATDTVVGILDNVRCTGNTSTGTSVNHRTIVRIAMWGFTREEVAKKLRQLADSDCWIDIAANDTGEFSQEVRDLLHHERINVDNADAGPRWMHAKYLLVEGNYDGTPDNKVVWMGSHNLTLNALRSNDETLLKIDRNKIHDQFRTNFRKIMELSPDMW